MRDQCLPDLATAAAVEKLSAVDCGRAATNSTELGQEFLRTKSAARWPSMRS
jgi:hypothetical protein